MSSRNQTMMHKLRVYQDMQDIRNREKARGGTKKKYASRYSARHTNPVTEDPANQGLNWWERMLFNATQPFSNLSAAGMNYAQKVQEGEGSRFSQDIRDLYKDLQSRKGFEKTVRYGQIGKQLWRMMNGKEIDEEEEPELADLSELFDRDMYDEENAPRLNFLAPRKYRAARYLHDIRLRGEGWLRGQEGDYELLNNYITKNYGSLPVYQTARDYDNISRKDLVAIGNRLNMVNSSLGRSAYLPGDYHFALPDSHADSSAFYIDHITNQYYQKTWDIEKYKNGAAYENIYEDSEKELANKLDDFGSPVVITTGFQPVYKTGKNGEKGDIFTLNDILGESPDPQDYANYEAWDVLRKQTNDMMAKRGMFMQDVGPNGEMKYAAKPIEVFGDRVKRHVAEKRYGGREKLRGGRQRRLRIAQDVKNVMENEAIRYDEIQPRQLDEIVVTPTGVQGKYSSDKVNEVIGKQWRNRFTEGGVITDENENTNEQTSNYPVLDILDRVEDPLLMAELATDAIGLTNLCSGNPYAAAGAAILSTVFNGINTGLDVAQGIGYATKGDWEQVKQNAFEAGLGALSWGFGKYLNRAYRGSNRAAKGLISMSDDTDNVIQLFLPGHVFGNEPSSRTEKFYKANGLKYDPVR